MAYKLFYFNVKGLAEPIRFLLSYGNLKFEDIRYEGEEWPKVKNTFPLGHVPVLEIDGKKMSHSTSICRFLAKKVGLAGSNDMEDFEIDSVIDTINDFRTKISIVKYEPNPAIQEEKRKALIAEIIPFYLAKLEEMAKANNGHLALKRRTWADLYFAGSYEYLSFASQVNLIEKQPNLKKVVDNVLAIESIKNWVAKRPKTDS